MGALRQRLGAFRARDPHLPEVPGSRARGAAALTSLGGLNEDFFDLLRELAAASAQYLIVGAYAMAVHGVPRATGDLDLWVCPDRENAARVLAALVRFGAPVERHGLTVEDLATPGTVYQIGLPPRRIDLLTAVSGLVFQEAWNNRLEMIVAGVPVAFLGRDDLIRNKKASGREKVLFDLALLRPEHR